MRERFYLICHTRLANIEKICTIFDVIDLSVSHSMKAAKSRMAKEDRFKDYIEDLNS